MHERTTRKSVTFLHPFSLAGVDGKLEAGTYLVETLEELIEGLSFVAFRRDLTTIATLARATAGLRDKWSRLTRAISKQRKGQSRCPA